MLACVPDDPGGLGLNDTEDREPLPQTEVVSEGLGLQQGLLGGMPSGGLFAEDSAMISPDDADMCAAEDDPMLPAEGEEETTDAMPDRAVHEAAETRLSQDLAALMEASGILGPDGSRKRARVDPLDEGAGGFVNKMLEAGQGRDAQMKN